MEIEAKRPDHIVPSYSLTGDLLSYLRCRLQYRYYNGSSLPPSRPVQLWVGEFLHGTLEMAYRHWAEFDGGGHSPPEFPWPCTKKEWREPAPSWSEHDIGKFGYSIEQALGHQGIYARSRAARDSAYQRVDTAVNRLGPHLFPLIAAAERRVIGTRKVPTSDRELRCQTYEVHGVIDVLTHVTLTDQRGTNLIRDYVQQRCGTLSGLYEVIVDYKGTKRPLVEEGYWNQGEWQILTYAWLRKRQPEAYPVAAGILIYINELSPGDAEMQSLKKGLANGTTDVAPDRGSPDEQIVRMWRPGMSTTQLSLDFRLRRAIRVIPATRQGIEHALDQFDKVVLQTEEDVAAESNGRDILHAWAPNCADETTCAACDFRHFCPAPAGVESGNHVVKAPSAP